MSALDELCVCCGRRGESAGSPPRCWGCLECSPTTGTHGATHGRPKSDLVPYTDGGFVRWRLRTPGNGDWVPVGNHASAIGAGFTTPGHWDDNGVGGWVHVRCDLCNALLRFHTRQRRLPDFARAAQLVAEHRLSCRGVQQTLFELADVPGKVGAW